MRVLAGLWVMCGALAWGNSAPPAAPIAITRVVEVDGRPLSIDGTISLRAAAPPGSGTRATALIDLSGIVGALHAGLQRRLPRDRCQRRAVDNWVVQLRRYHVGVDADSLLVEVGLDVEVWACFQWKGSELRRRVADGRVYARLPLRLEVVAEGLRLRAGRPQVDAYGPLGDAARMYFAARGMEMGDLLARKVAELDARQAAFPVPPLWLHQGTLRSARFIDAGRPSMEIVAELRPWLPDWAQRLLGRTP